MIPGHVDTVEQGPASGTDATRHAGQLAALATLEAQILDRDATIAALLAAQDTHNEAILDLENQLKTDEART